MRRAKLYYLRDLRGKAAKIREKRDGVEGYGDGITSTPELVSEVIAESAVSEVSASEVTAEVVEVAVEAPVAEATEAPAAAEETAEEAK